MFRLHFLTLSQRVSQTLSCTQLCIQLNFRLGDLCQSLVISAITNPQALVGVFEHKQVTLHSYYMALLLGFAYRKLLSFIVVRYINMSE